MGTIIVSGILLLAVCGIITGLIRKRKQGSCSCGGDCSRCKCCSH